MHIRHNLARLIQRANPYESNGRATSSVVGPHRNRTSGTACNGLSPAAQRRCLDGDRFFVQVDDVLGREERVDGEGGTGFALTPRAVTAVDDQGLAGEAVADGAAGAAASESLFRSGWVHCRRW